MLCLRLAGADPLRVHAGALRAAAGQEWDGGAGGLPGDGWMPHSRGRAMIRGVNVVESLLPLVSLLPLLWRHLLCVGGITGPVAAGVGKVSLGI